MSFWDVYDDAPIDLTPEGKAIRAEATRKRAANVVPGHDAVVEQCSPEPCSQNDLAGVCDWCGIASDDLLLGVCSDCV